MENGNNTPMGTVDTNEEKNVYSTLPPGANWKDLLGNIQQFSAAPTNTKIPKTLEQSIGVYKTGASTDDLYIYVAALKKWIKSSFAIV